MDPFSYTFLTGRGHSTCFMWSSSSSSSGWVTTWLGFSTKTKARQKVIYKLTLSKSLNKEKKYLNLFFQLGMGEIIDWSIYSIIIDRLFSNFKRSIDYLSWFFHQFIDTLIIDNFGCLRDSWYEFSEKNLNKNQLIQICEHFLGLGTNPNPNND
jgi:hypothetical protein